MIVYVGASCEIFVYDASRLEFKDDLWVLLFHRFNYYYYYCFFTPAASGVVRPRASSCSLCKISTPKERARKGTFLDSMHAVCLQVFSSPREE